MKIQNNVFGKSDNYYTMMSRQEKRQRAESQLKEALNKKAHNSSKYALLTKIQYALAQLRTLIRTTFVICSRHWFVLLTGVICFRHIPVFGLLMRVCNPKGTVRVFHKEKAIYYK